MRARRGARDDRLFLSRAVYYDAVYKKQTPPPRVDASSSPPRPPRHKFVLASLGRAMRPTGIFPPTSICFGKSTRMSRN